MTALLTGLYLDLQGELKMVKKIFHNLIIAAMTVAVAATFTTQAFGQKNGLSKAGYPHDFSDKYYFVNGVNPGSISFRLTGKDGLSVGSSISDPRFSKVRVLVTMPAYLYDEKLAFWNPLGQFNASGFTQDNAGIKAREVAARYPIYVFPSPRVTSDGNIFFSMRQAALIDESRAISSDIPENPLGLRQIFIVTYTKEATTAEGAAILKDLAGLNGYAADGGPIVNSIDDLKMLGVHGLITISSGPGDGMFAVAPIIKNATTGGIAPDAFLHMATNADGKPLPAEELFIQTFNCAKGACSEG
jgi:hypothetical protein